MDSVENIVTCLNNDSKTKCDLAVAAFEEFGIELDESKPRDEMLVELTRGLEANQGKVPESAKPVMDEETFAGWKDMGGGIYGRKIGQNAVLARDVVTMCTMALEGVTIIGDVFTTK